MVVSSINTPAQTAKLGGWWFRCIACLHCHYFEPPLLGLGFLCSLVAFWVLSAAGLVAGYALGLATWVRPALMLFLYRGVAANGRTAVSRVERSVGGLRCVCWCCECEMKLLISFGDWSGLNTSRPLLILLALQFDSFKTPRPVN